MSHVFGDLNVKRSKITASNFLRMLLNKCQQRVKDEMVQLKSKVSGYSDCRRILDLNHSQIFSSIFQSHIV